MGGVQGRDTKSWSKRTVKEEAPATHLQARASQDQPSARWGTTPVLQVGEQRQPGGAAKGR